MSVFVKVPLSIEIAGIPVEDWGVVLEVDGEATAIPLQEMESIDFDAEASEEITEMYVTYQGIEYSVELSNLTELDSEVLEEVLNPE